MEQDELMWAGLNSLSCPTLTLINCKFLVVLKKIWIEKIFFVVVPYAPIYHIPIGLNNIFNNYYIYSHMIRSLLIEFGQARQDNIWSSATKLSQWIHNTLSTTVKERHLTFFTIHVIMDVCSKGFIAGAHLQKAKTKTMYWFRSFVFGN